MSDYARPIESSLEPVVTTLDQPRVEGRSRLPDRRQVLAGVSASYVQSAIALLVGFISTPLYVKYLGGELFGLWVTLWSIIGYFHLSTTGTMMTGTVWIAEAHARGEKEKMSRMLVTTSFIWLAAAALAIVVLAFLVAFGVIRASLFGDSPAVTAVALPVLMILAAGFLVSQPLDVFRLAVRSCQRVDLEQSYTAIFRVVILVAGITVLVLGGGLIGFALVTVLGQLGLELAFAGAARRIVPGLRLSPSLFDAQMARQFISPSLHFLAISIAGSLIWGTDNLVISINLGTASVTLFAVAMQLLNIGSGLIATTVNALMPTVTALHALSEEIKLRRVLLRVVKIGFALATLLGVGFASFGEELLRLWVGASYLAPRSVLSVLLAIFLIRAFAMLFEMVVMGTLRHHRYAYMVLAEGILNLALSLILVKRWGLLGVALGTLMAQVACTGWFLPALAMRVTGCRLKEVILKSVLPVLPAVAIAALAAQLFTMLPLDPGWTRFLIGSGLTASAFAAGFWLTGLNAEEKELFRLMRKGVR